MKEIRGRVRGGLIGIAYGDAFGMPSEMWTPDRIKAVFGKIDRFLPGHPDHMISSKLVKGEVTDDTINSVLVVEMLGENYGNVDPHLFIRKLKQWIAGSAKSAAVVGPSTAKAIALMEEGVPMEETGKMGTTNGGAMKILPVGLKAGSRDGEIDDNRLIEEVAKLCLPTHNTSCAISGATAIAAGGAAAVGGCNTVEEIYEYMMRMAERGSGYGNPIGGPSIAKRMEMGRYFADHYPEEQALKMIYDYVGTGLSSAESVPAAAALFYMAKGNPTFCARYAANIGGDTDTMGAMACGISGAYMGARHFAEEEVEMLETVNGISFDRLTDLLLCT
ncbi:MAG TPA: ADP-ribosylglycohydrolase family protein [Candidatus Pelethocola excrementipullorum]|nr:ADP-ribosylglycohydrolase family protein [Candidatus Pelethocola excrementipullorum]